LLFVDNINIVDNASVLV